MGIVSNIKRLASLSTVTYIVLSLLIFTVAPATVTAASPVKGGLVIPSTGAVTEDFLGTFSQESWFSSYYDQNNTPQTRTQPEHSGVDISNTTADCTPKTKTTPASGQPVYPAAPGTVIWAGFDPTANGTAQSFGWSVVVRHGNNIGNNNHYTYTLYGHMGTVGYKKAASSAKGSASCLNVTVGQTVSPFGSASPTILGYQGSSGLAAPATHVHFTVFEGTKDFTKKLKNPYVPDAFPASLDPYVCLNLTSGDANPTTSVAAGDSKCNRTGANPVTGVDVGNGGAVLGTAVNPVTNTIYATDFNTCSLAVIDGSTYTITTHIPLGCFGGPGGQAVAVNPVTNKIYVTTCGSNAPQLIVIDGNTNTVLSHVGGRCGFTVATNPTTSQVFLTDGAGNLIIYDGSSGTIDSTTPVMQVHTANILAPGVAVNPITNLAYVANGGTNTVSVVDTVGNIVSTIPVTGAVALAINQSANIVYATDEDSGAITIIDGNTNTVTNTVPIAVAHPAAIGYIPATNSLVTFSDQAPASGEELDASTFSVVKSFPIGDTINDGDSLAVDPTTSRFFLIQSSSVDVYQDN